MFGLGSWTDAEQSRDSFALLGSEGRCLRQEFPNMILDARSTEISSGASDFMGFWTVCARGVGQFGASSSTRARCTRQGKPPKGSKKLPSDERLKTRSAFADSGGTQRCDTLTRYSYTSSQSA